MTFEIFLETENGKISFGSLDFANDQTLCAQNIQLTTTVVNTDDYSRVNIRVLNEHKGFITVRCNYDKGVLYTFSGEKNDYGVFRQSPHDSTDHIIDTPKETVPMVGVKTDGDWTILFSDNPAVYDNYTT